MEGLRMIFEIVLRTTVILTLLSACAGAAESTPVRLTIEPGATVLVGRRSTAQFLATGHFADGSVRDLTHEATWTCTEPGVLSVEPGGFARPRRDGRGAI